ncbi:MAG TPA: glycosyltransferase family 2 protein [Candidatus Obscuribacterales bacterium]
MARPTLSVHLSNYNDASSIGEAIEAIVRQSHAPDEFVIVDDGSTDESIEVIERYMRKYPIIRLVRNDKNYGVVYTINRGLSLATGDYIYFASANDRVLPGFFKTSMSLLKQFPTAAMSCTDARLIYADTGREITNGAKRFVDKAGFLTGPQLAAKLNGKAMHGASYITRRQILVEMGGYLPQLRWHCDYFLHHMIAFRFGTCYIPEELVLWRYAERGAYSSGRHNLPMQRQVLREMIRLLAQPEYSGLVDLVARAQLLAIFRPAMNGRQLLNMVQDAATQPQATLLRYLLWESSVGKSQWLVEQSAEILANRCEQIWARSFHEYDRLRSLLSAR